MKKEVAEAWVKDLRENPPQAQERLYDGFGYCCLGRLCVVLGFEFEPDDGKFIVSHVNETEGAELPAQVIERAGMATPYGGFTDDTKIVTPGGGVHTSLVDLNDEAGYSFAEIADVIEQHWEKL